MRLVFEGLERPIDLTPGNPFVLQIETPSLFARFVAALNSLEGRYSVEPYTIWEGEKELNPKGSFLVILSPFSLPWTDRQMLGQVTKRMEKEFVDDEDLRIILERLNHLIESRLLSLTSGLSADYYFGDEWNFGKTLKTLGFRVGQTSDSSLLDELLSFLSLALDAGLKKTIVFVNLKTFLTEKELIQFYEHVFYTKLRVLMLENKQDIKVYEYEQKRTIDLDFLEY